MAEDTPVKPYTGKYAIFSDCENHLDPGRYNEAAFLTFVKNDKPMIPFSPPRIDQDIIEEVTRALQSGWITTGPRTKHFEKEISKYTGADATVCLNSATAGMELVLRWFGVGRGDEVIVPAYTYCATANVVLHCGARPVMVDTLPGEFNLDPVKVREAISERTKAIMPVDIGGIPCNYDALRAIVHDSRVKELFHPKTGEQQKLNRILLLADSAHAFGAVYKGHRLGSIADVTTFSFHAVKNLTTAEGGAACLKLPSVFDPEEVYKTLTVMSLHGQSKDALAKTQKGAWKYDVLFPGYKCNMTDIQAAIGLVELSRYNSETLPRRRELSRLYARGLGKYAWAILPEIDLVDDSESSYHLFQLRIKGAGESQRDAIIAEIAERDVAVNVHFQPLPLLSAYRELDYQMADYPNAYAQYANEISLPLFYNLTDMQVVEVIDAVASAVSKVMKA